MAPFPHPAHRTGQADLPHPALGQDFTLSRATPSAASEEFSELIGCPISKSFTTYCVCLELRSLPSTGVTRLPRYYEPLRHPRAPSLSVSMRLTRRRAPAPELYQALRAGSAQQAAAIARIRRTLGFSPVRHSSISASSVTVAGTTSACGAAPRRRE